MKELNYKKIEFYILYCLILYNMSLNADIHIKKIRKYANRGDAHSQYLLGLNYCQQKEMIKAFYWLYNATINGSDDAFQKLMYIYYYGEDLDTDYIISKKKWNKVFSIN